MKGRAQVQLEVRDMYAQLSGLSDEACSEQIIQAARMFTRFVRLNPLVHEDDELIPVVLAAYLRLPALKEEDWPVAHEVD